MLPSRPTLWLSLLLVLLLVPAGPAVGAAPDDDCPPVRPVSEVARGDVGSGLTVSSGTTPEPFDVTVVDVLTDALAPGVPLIVVDTDSAEIDRVGGIWYGMSGSPVHIDGELIGAIAYGFSWGPSKLAGVTPAAAMLDVPNRPTLPPPPGAGAEADEVAMSSRVRAHAAAEEGLSAQQAGSMEPLQVPVRVSGPGGAKLRQFAAAFEQAHPGTTVVRSGGGSGTTAEATPIVPGGNLAVSLSYGDFNAIGVGTTTAVCDGQVIGFGHPMLFSGATRLGLHGASAVKVADDSVFGPYKLANAGPIVGTIEQDRLAAVSGPLGTVPPTTAITTTITNLDDGRSATGRTDSVWPGFLFWGTLIHGWINFDSRVLDTWAYAGTSEVSWTISGVRADGTPWEVTRGNRHADAYDLSTASLLEVAATASQLHDNPYEEVRVTAVDYEATTSAPYRSYRILEDRITVDDGDGPVDASDGIVVAPGSTLRLTVPLRLYRAGVHEVDLELEIPDDAGGYGFLEITGGQGFDEDCIWWPEDCADGTTVDGFEDLLDGIAERSRADDLVGSLHLFPDDWDDWDDWDDFLAANGGDDGRGSAIAEARVRLDQVVTGWADLPVSVGSGPPGDCPVEPELPFWDVDPDNIHAPAIACAFALGITRGVSLDPPLYAPRDTVRRDQAASFVARVLEQGPKPLPAGQGRFSDLDGNAHGAAIEQLAAAGIVRGRTATTFDPRQPVTRAQMATLLVQALQWATDEPIEAVGGPYFSDVAGAHAGNIDAGYELGLLHGRDDGTFAPARSTRRDQMASLLLRFHLLAADG